MFEKNLAQFSKNYRTFFPKIVMKLKKYGIGIRDPGSATLHNTSVPEPDLVF
jgi:hypothetical protein